MNPLSTSPLLGQTASDLATDTRSLDALKRDAGRDPQGVVKKAAQQFEALFMQMVLKSMRDATPKSGMFDSSANDMYTGMLDQQLATKVAAGGTGLADMIARQLTRHMKGASDIAPAAPGVRNAAPGVQGARTAPPIPEPQRIEAPPAAPRSASEAMSTSADWHKRHFATSMWDHALSAERATGIPARFIVGQAALESGWGAREIRGADGLRSYNLFGIKAGANWQGRTVDALTTEYEGGVAKKVVQKFRAYNNYGEAFRDWARLMAGNPRYGPVLANSRDAQGFAYGLQRAGYATDPNYGAKLTRVINAAQSVRGSA